MADDPVDAFFQSVSDMADSIGFKGEKKDRYVHEHMIRAGYRAIPTYVKEEEGEDEDDFFSSRRPRARRTRSNEDDDDGGSRRSGSWF